MRWYPRASAQPAPALSVSLLFVPFSSVSTCQANQLILPVRLSGSASRALFPAASHFPVCFFAHDLLLPAIFPRQCSHLLTVKLPNRQIFAIGSLSRFYDSARSHCFSAVPAAEYPSFRNFLFWFPDTGHRPAPPTLYHGDPLYQADTPETGCNPPGNHIPFPAPGTARPSGFPDPHTDIPGPEARFFH